MQISFCSPLGTSSGFDLGTSRPVCKKVKEVVCNGLGFIPDELLPEVFASFGRLPSPICMKLQGGYLGSNNPVQIDQFGNNLTSACNVIGGDTTIRHGTVKHALNDTLLVTQLKTN
jgi:hypothetical protein